MARDASAVEVYAWTLINDTRAAAGVQPVALDPVLLDAAEFHTDDQIAKNTFEHTSDLPGLVSQHGWQWRAGTYEFWENHAWWGNAGLTEHQYADQNHLNLVNSSSHYAAMTDATVRVVGVGIESGPAVDGEGPAYRGLTDYQYITQLFGDNERQSYITGVAYDDLNSDGAYDIGEGENGTTVRVVDINTGETWTGLTDDGYFAFEVGAGTYDVFTEGGGANEQIADNLVVGNLNIRLDDRDTAVVDPDPPQTYTFTNPNSYQIINGFDPNEDVLDFSPIDANPKKNAPGDQAFKWLPNTTKPSQHELWITHQDFDSDGDMDTVFRIDTGNATNSIAYLTDVQLTPADFTVGVDLIL
jgi:hypothetical protein